MIVPKRDFKDIDHAYVDARAIEHKDFDGSFVEVGYQGCPGKLFYGQLACFLFEPIIEQKRGHKE